jgi:hypothetical protein
MDIKREIDEVLKKHRSLIYNLENNSLGGELFLPEGDSYSLIIKFDSYPEFFPSVFEVGGRIPVKMDRHMYTDTGSCCFTTAAISQILLKTKIVSLLKFFDEIVVRYLENNSYYEIHGEYLYDEYNHGSMGVVESYKDILGISDVKSIGRLMLQRLKNEKLRIKDYCYCNSGNKLKKCNNGSHSHNYRLFRMIDKKILRNDIEHFLAVLDP